MSLNKKVKGWKGLLACIIHCLLWTVSMYVFAFWKSKSILVFALLFLSHFVLDRTGLVKLYCIKTHIMPNPALWKLFIVDNTLHLLMVFGIYKLFM